jgi:hypothetical protein
MSQGNRFSCRIAISLCRAVILMIAAAAAVGAGDGVVFQQPTATPSGEAVYWCSMHPDIRGRDGDKCPVCGMALVRAEAANYRPYLLDFETVPHVLRARQKARVRFFVREPQAYAIVRRFELVHERVFHLFVVSQDLEYFAHVHPTLHRDGSLEVDVELPRPGVYQMIADFLPTGGAPQLVQKSFVTAGYAGRLLAMAHLTPDAADKVVGDTRVKLIMPEPLAGREQLVTFELQDVATGAAVTDLEPYLGATGHLLLASANLAIAAHSHPVAEISAPGGPDIVFQMIFPRAGDYRMWIQFQRRGEVRTASFTVPVKGRY